MSPPISFMHAHPFLVILQCRYFFAFLFDLTEICALSFPFLFDLTTSYPPHAGALHSQRERERERERERFFLAPSPHLHLPS